MNIVGDDGNNTLNGTEEDDVIKGKGGDDDLHGMGGNDHLFGNTGNDNLDGGDGNDTLDGGGGHDTVHGGAGDDVVIATAGGDTYDGGTGGNDTLDFSAVTTSLNLNEKAGTLSDTNLGHEASVVGFETIIAGSGFDTLVGSIGDDTMIGNAGGDTISGSSGADTLNGNEGNDLLNGGTGTDTLSGGQDNDRLNGNVGDDMLFGGSGNDVLDGGAGGDVMDGGDGIDKFHYGVKGGVEQSTSVNYDTFVNFDATQDKIALWFNVGGIDTAVNGGQLDNASYDADLQNAIGSGQLAAGHAVFFTPDSGSDANELYLIVDVNGTAGYQGGQDLVFEFDNATNMGSFSLANFT